MQKRLSAVGLFAAAAVVLTSVAAAAADATKQRVAIELQNLPSGTFVFTPLHGGTLKGDSGSAGFGAPPNYSARTVIREGQSVDVYPPVVWLLKGKRGTLTIREPANAWVDTGDAGIATGKWQVVRGTGQYARVVGGGRNAHVGHNGGTGPWFARQEGFLITKEG